jgi:hypothetical protein
LRLNSDIIILQQQYVFLLAVVILNGLVWIGMGN